MIATTDATFSEDVLSNDRPTLVVFHAAWSGPCKLLLPTLSALESLVDVVTMDIDVNVKVAERYDIRGIPLMMLVVRGQAVSWRVGAAGIPLITEWLEPYVNALV